MRECWADWVGCGECDLDVLGRFICCSYDGMVAKQVFKSLFSEPRN